MKVHADKIETGPAHSLCVSDLRRILAAVPPEWIQELRDVHLTNSLEIRFAWAFFSRYDGRLTVYSRCGTPTEALIAVLGELAACALGLTARQRHRRSKAEAHRVGQLIRPLLGQLLPLIAPPNKKRSPHSWAGLRPISLNELAEPDDEPSSGE